MNIWVAGNLFAPIVSGSSTYTTRIVREYAARGERVTVFVPKSGADDAAVDRDLAAAGVRVVRVRRLKMPQLAIAFRFNHFFVCFPFLLAALLKEHRAGNIPDVIHQQEHIFDSAIATRIYCALKRKPRAITLHTPVQHPSRIYNFLLKIGEALVIHPLFVAKRDAFISPDRTVERYLKALYPRHPTVVIPYGIVPTPPAPVTEPELAALRDAHSPVIASVGHIHELRHRCDLVRAVAKLRARFPRIGLLLVGAEQTPVTRALVNELGLQDHVKFLGSRPRAQIAQILGFSVAEAHWIEGMASFGLATLECMGGGTPVLCNVRTEDCTFSPEVRFVPGREFIQVKNGDADGIGEAIAGLVADPALARRVADHGKAMVERHFAWPGVAAATAGFFRSHFRIAT